MKNTANIASRLAEAARLAPERPAVIVGGCAVTFRELDEDADRIAAGLRALGLGRGVRTAVMVPPGPDLFALTFALFRLGAVPVLVDPGIGFGSLGRCLEEAEPEAFIGSPKAHLARKLGGWARRTLRFWVCAGGPWPGALTLGAVRRLGTGEVQPAADCSAADTAAILFTSGSTGAPKGAVYTHGIFSAQVDILRELFGILPGQVSVPTFPLFALFDVALGMTAVIPEMDASRPAAVDPRLIIEPALRHGAVQLFGSPALLDAVGRYGEARGVRLPALKRVIAAGAPVSPRIIARFAKLLGPEAQIFTPYGATEALPVSLIGSREILGETAGEAGRGRGVCVGRPVPGIEAFVIRITDEAIPAWSPDLAVKDGEVGEIAVRGPVISASYHNRPDATALAKIRGPGGTVIHRMGDLGYRDGRGRLWFCGRKSHRVRTKRGVLYTVPCEAVFNRHPRVRRTALVGVGEPGSQLPVLCVELEPGVRPDPELLKAELLALGGAHEPTRRITTVLFHPRFPVDIRHNAKIAREILAVWAASRVP